MSRTRTAPPSAHGADSLYKEALQLDAEDGRALCALARLYLMNDDLDQCQYTCMTLLR